LYVRMWQVWSYVFPVALHRNNEVNLCEHRIMIVSVDAGRHIFWNNGKVRHCTRELLDATCFLFK
jgi:hypothetical protein